VTLDDEFDLGRSPWAAADPTPQAAPPPVAVIRAEVPDAGKPKPIALVFPSSSGSTEPHVVIVIDVADGQQAVVCTCKAMRSIARRPLGCWAMVRSRAMLGLPEPTTQPPDVEVL